MRFRFLSAAVATAFLFGATRAEAQRRPRGRAGRSGRLATLLAPRTPELGIRGTYATDVDAGGVGALLRFPVGPSRHLDLLPSGDLQFANGATLWQANADVAIRPGRVGLFYAGGGLALLGGAGDVRTGVNLLAGLHLPGRRVRPFGEVRWTFVDGGTRVRLGGGLAIPLGGRR